MKFLPRSLALSFIACMIWLAPALTLANHADKAGMTFGVISARSAVMTAQYWNPILRYVSQKSGVPLRLTLAKSSIEMAAMVRHGELDFIFSNYQYAPGNAAARYAVIARPLAGAIRSQIVVPADSSITSLDQLRGQVVAFSSKVAFAGYHVPIDALLRSGITVRPQFAGTAEGALGRMQSGRAAAAGAGSIITRTYAERQQMAYRVLWSSEEYPAVPIAAHLDLPKEKVEKVRTALLSMADDPQGREILAASAPLFGSNLPQGFAAASDEEYESMHRFYKHRLAPPETP